MEYLNRRLNYINSRYTPSEKARIERKSRQLGITKGEYVRNCALAGTERNRVKDKRRVAAWVRQLEQLNQNYYNLKNDSRVGLSENEIKKMMEDLMIWEF